MTRQFWVLVHRYAGLYMAFFLTVAGVTGSILAFYHELDSWLNPERYHVVVQNTPMLDDFTLRDKAIAKVPQAQINQIIFNRYPGQIYEAGLIAGIDPANGKPYELSHQSIRLNPYNGELIDYGNSEGLWPLSLHNILNVIYSLHYSLALGEVGLWLLGIAALIWTFDCFVGFYLTLPVWRRSQYKTGTTTHQSLQTRGFWSRWAVAWKIKWSASVFRINFDLHRAGGLWTWLMLFVFAWSSVAFNLGQQVYQPVMKVLFDLPDFNQFPITNLPESRPTPNLDWHNAHAIGQRLMSEQAQVYHFQVLAEETLAYQPEKGAFFYTVKSDLDINEQNSNTTVWFDGNNGAFVGVLVPSGQNAGMTISLWLFTLHMARIWGLPYKIFVCLMGLVVAMLSVTGVYIWLKKRRAAERKRKGLV